MTIPHTYLFPPHQELFIPHCAQEIANRIAESLYVRHPRVVFRQIELRPDNPRLVRILWSRGTGHVVEWHDSKMSDEVTCCREAADAILAEMENWIPKLCGRHDCRMQNPGSEEHCVGCGSALPELHPGAPQPVAVQVPSPAPEIPGPTPMTDLVSPASTEMKKIRLRVILLPRAEKALVFEDRRPRDRSRTTVPAWSPDEMPFDAPLELNRDRLASRFGCPEIPASMWEEVAENIIMSVRSTLQVLRVDLWSGPGSSGWSVTAL